jgi:cell division protein ZapB
MDADLAELEEKIRQAAAVCKRLSVENLDLRAQVLTLAGDRQKLTEKLDSARARLESLLKQIPE